MMDRSTLKPTASGRRKVLAALAALLIPVLAPALASAANLHFGLKNDTRTFIAVMNGGQEATPTTSGAVGNALMDFNKKTKILCYALSFVGLTGDDTRAHFHGPAPIGVSAAIRRNITEGGAPSPVGTPKTGCVGPLTLEEEIELRRGLWYINVHSAAFPGGEIRGQVVPVDKPTVSAAP